MVKWEMTQCFNWKNELIQTLVRNSVKAPNLYLNPLKSATKEIFLIFPTTNALVRWEKLSAIRLSKEVAMEQKVKVRILMPVSKLTEHIVQSVSQTQQQQQHNIDIGYIEQMSGNESTILVVDRTVSLVMELKDDSKLTFVEAIGLSVEAIGLSTKSNNKDLILSYVYIFENLWNQFVLYHEIKESHEQLKVTNQKLEINDKTLNNFIRSTNYELINLIQSILGISQIANSR